MLLMLLPAGSLAASFVLVSRQCACLCPPPCMQVSGLSVGDHVVPMQPALGTWRRAAKYPAEQVYVVPKELPVDTAAQLIIK